MIRVGDKVRVTDNFANEEYYDIGDEGVVVEFDGEDFRVDFGKERSHAGSFFTAWYVGPYDLEKVINPVNGIGPAVGKTVLDYINERIEKERKS